MAYSIAWRAAWPVIACFRFGRAATAIRPANSAPFKNPLDEPPPDRNRLVVPPEATKQDTLSQPPVTQAARSTALLEPWTRLVTVSHVPVEVGWMPETTGGTAAGIAICAGGKEPLYGDSASAKALVLTPISARSVRP